MIKLYKKFRANIKRNKFIQNDDVVLVGVSGGVDSMVLAHLLLKLRKDIPFKLTLAHVNYKLRGAESDAQEKLVHDFAVQNGVIALSLRGPEGRGNPGAVNFQKSARDFRYHYFAEVAAEIGADSVMVAHHLEDQVETILAQLLRGSSLKGLSGMKAMRSLAKVPLIRPLLSFSKKDLIAYAQENKVSFIEDSSNASDTYWRNRLRHELLPVIENLRPKAFEKITRLGEEMAELSHYLSATAKDWLKEFARRDEKSFWIPRPRFILLPKTLRLEILQQAYLQWQGHAADLKHDHLVRCDQIASGPKPEASYSLPANVRFQRSADNCQFIPPIAKNLQVR
ncbi:MAG: tRNA lysidine(34) synthetase TilS [Deltaproteobacteria bacterium]|nr:tRNA lysidine(34) synthetase TilS [Deltaproteobacteria bacterium]